MLSHCNVPSRGATGNFSKFASPRLVWKAVQRELQQGYFSMDRNIAWADCTASCRCSGLKGSSEKYILWKERSKLENAAFWKNPEKIWLHLAKIQQNSGKTCEILEKNSKISAKNSAIFNEKFEIRERCKGVHCVDLGESFPTSIYLLIWLRYSRERAL